MSGACEKRARVRFAALVQDSIWLTLRGLVREIDQRDDEYAWDEFQQHLITLSRRLGLPIGPAICYSCERPRPELGDVPDQGENTCPHCIAERAEREAERARERARAEAEWNALSDEEKEAQVEQQRRILDGLIRRDVQ